VLVKGRGLQLSDLMSLRNGIFTTGEASSNTAPVDPLVVTAASETAVQIPEDTLPESSGLINPAWSATPPAPLRIEDSDRELRIAPAPSPLPKPAAAPVTSVAAAPMGALAVSAAVPVEIYRGEENLGSTPATLRLAEGAQTLEYRYQGLRQTLTHVIARDQTTTATVSFVIKVQINAQPWAQVFMEGVNLNLIGQTPLGDVSVPIGGVLVFQNPKYPDKRYRVTARDTAIQITFP
jgi:hypothetical protein